MIVDGFQVPVIPLVEVVGRLGAVAPWQIGSIGLKMGFTIGNVFTIIVTILPHCPPDGVNV